MLYAARERHKERQRERERERERERDRQTDRQTDRQNSIRDVRRWRAGFRVGIVMLLCLRFPTQSALEDFAIAGEKGFLVDGFITQGKEVSNCRKSALTPTIVLRT